MRKLAAKPFCVWFDCGKTRTFTTRAAAEAFARKCGRDAQIGVWCDASCWWVEVGIQLGLPDDVEEPGCETDRYPIFSGA